MTGLQRQDFWDALRFGCTECGGCCRRPGYVELLPTDIERLLGFLSLDDITFFERYSVTSFGLNFALHVDDETPCVFLDGDKCSVFSARPAQCRTYPFWPELLESEAVWNDERRHCPGIGQGSRYSAETIIRLSEGEGATLALTARTDSSTDRSD